jgi:hypothetical protein
LAYEAAVAGDVGAEDGGELAVKAFLLHGGTSALLKVHHVAKGLLLSKKDAGGAPSRSRSRGRFFRINLYLSWLGVIKSKLDDF